MLLFVFTVLAAESIAQFKLKHSRSCCLQINQYQYEEAELREPIITGPMQCSKYRKEQHKQNLMAAILLDA